jgi:HEAT repeat protein
VGALERRRFAESRLATAIDASSVDASDLVVPLLRARDARLRYWATLLIGRYPFMPGLSRVLDILARDPEPHVRKAAIETIGRLGFGECAGRLLERLSDPVAYVRGHAARALGQLGEARSAAAVAALLADRDWLVRDAARRSLESMGLEVAPFLVHTLSDPDVFARNGAAEVLQNLGILDALVAKYTRQRAAWLGRLIEQIVFAGGPRIWESVLSRLDETARTSLQQLVPLSRFDELVADRL